MLMGTLISLKNTRQNFKWGKQSRRRQLSSPDPVQKGVDDGHTTRAELGTSFST